MKKAFSILLCLVLLLGLNPGALAAEADEPKEPETAEEAACEAQAAPPAQAEPEEKPVYEELPILPREDEEDAELMGAAGTVTVTVSFPAGTSASGKIYIYLARAAATDETGLVTAEPEIRSEWKTVNGSSAFTVSFTNVEAGNYFFGVYSYDADTVGLIQDTYYLNADGTKAAGMYTATTFAVGEGASVSRSITLQKLSARTISGTLQFTKPLAQDLRLRVMSNGDSSSSNYFNVSAGATSAPFSVMADETADVYIDFYNSTTGGGWHRYCINGTLEGEWSEVAYFSPARGSVSGLVINGDALLEGTAASAGVRTTVTVKLPEAMNTYRSFYIYATDSKGSTRSASIWSIEPGESEFSVTFGSLSKDMPYIFSYAEVTDVNRIYAYSDACGKRYAAEGGITSLASNAKVWTFTGDTATVTIQEPSCLKITGVLDRGGFMAGGGSIGYVSAAFEDGETFTALVNFNGKETEREYAIYVPAAYKNKTYSLTAARAQEISSNCVLEISRTEPVTGVLSGNVTAAKISIAADGVTVSGHAALPEGTVIPAGGICVHIYDMQTSLGVRYIFREGLTEADFTFTDFTEESDVSFYSGLENASGLETGVSRYAELSDSGFTGLSFTFRPVVTVSGKIKLPEGVTDLAANVELYAANSSTTLTIFKGETEAPYSVQVPAGEKAELWAELSAETYPCLAENWYYLNKEWQFGRSSGNYPVADKDRSGVDLIMGKARVASGTLVSEDGTALRLLPTLSTPWVYIGYISDKGSYEKGIQLKEDMSWSVKVPEEAAENCRIYVEVYQSSYINVASSYYYYSTGNEAVTAQDAAESLSIPEGGLSGLTLRVTAGWVLEGVLAIPEGGYVKSSYTSSTTVTVYAEDQEENYFYGSAWVTPDTTAPYFAIVVPAAAAAYTLSVDSSLGSSWTTNVIFCGETAETAVTGSMTGLSIPLELSKCTVSGSILRPADYSGYISPTVYVEMTDGETTGSTYSDGSPYMSDSSSGTSYRILIPASETMTRYRVRAYIGSSSNALASQIWLTETGVTTKESEAAVFTLGSEDRHDFTPIQQPSYLVGKIYIPEGITSPFNITFYGVGSQDFWIDPSACPRDDTGRYYAYKLHANRNYEDTYQLEYYVYSEYESDLYTDRTVYVQKDGSLVYSYSSADTRTYTPGETATQDFTLAKSILLKGSFTDEDGNALRFTGNSAYLYLGSTYCEPKIAEDGSWTLRLSPDMAGSYTGLYARPNSGDFEKALAGTYYYSSEGKVVTASSEASAVTFGAEGLSGLKIRMNTGWVITGRLVVPEGGYYRLKEGYSSYSNRITVYASNSSGYGSYSGYAVLTEGSGPWTYSITVPKEEASYNLTAYGSIYDYMDTNILFERSLYLEGVSVSGNTAVQDMELVIARAFISGTVTRPEGFTNYISMTVYVETAADTYPSSCYIYNNSSTCSYSIPIPSTDESSEYTLRCYTSTNGLVRNSWLTESGLSKKEADAKQYVFGTDSGTHDFTLLALSPYVSGKVYIPEDVEGTFSLYLYGYSYGNSLYLDVDTSTAQRDGQGRYVPYALTYDVEEMNFTLYYQVNSDNTGMLLNPCYYSMSSFYVTEGGTLSTKAGDAGTFHYTGETLSIDLTLLCWNDWDDRFIFQSAHGLQGPEYGSDALEYTYTYTIPEGCDSASFHFVCADCSVVINGRSYSAYNLNDRNQTFYRSSSEQVTITVKLTSNTKYYGFGVDSITLNGTPVPSVGSLYTENGSDPVDILSDVRAGKPLYAVFACGTDEGAVGAARKAVAAVYDADGRFQGAKLVDTVVNAGGNASARFCFKANDQISEIRVMLLDGETLAPVLQLSEIRPEG